jgi:N4-(beta-N-acetylglucosaminyl)-L-asparaginase
MSANLNRREFIAAGTAAIAGTVASKALSAQAPAIAPKGSPALVIASSNGQEIKNSDGLTCVELAFNMMAEGMDVLDSVIAGVNIVEHDPEDYSVGYGGLPNANGVVQLDASCMHGPKKQAGAVACLEGVRTPSLVAQKVMDITDHHLLVGKGAQDFARMMGFKVEDDINSPKSRELWLEWKRRLDPERWLDPEKRMMAGHRAGMSMVADGLIDGEHYYGTIHCSGMNSKGEICGVTTTSGLAWKIPGRIGDSPILGAGLYLEDKVGAAGSTGRGEANLFALCSFLIVELMRQGKHPKDAGIAALRRIIDNTVDKRLRYEKGQPNFQVIFYAMNAKGEHGGTSIYPTKYAICTQKGGQLLDTASIYAERPKK